jgi:DNA polymerase-1
VTLIKISEDPRLSRFRGLWARDFEYISRPGERPVLVCLAAKNLITGETFAWRADELGAEPPYPTDDGVCFFDFVSNAEAHCHLVKGWPTPRYTIDLSPAFRNLTNGRYVPEGKGLIGMLRYFGLDSISSRQKDAMRDLILRGNYTAAEWVQILKYCVFDVEAIARILPHILPLIDIDIALYHGEFATVSALMEYHGVPIDMEIFSQLADEKAWAAVRDEMVPIVDAQYRVYVRKNNAVSWSFSMELFVAYLKRAGIYEDWPKLDNGKLNMKQKVFEAMAKAYPQLEPLRQCRHTQTKMRKVKLAVGSDGRNRTLLWPFQSKTGRTQPKAAKWIYSPAVWIRSLIKPAEGMALASLDYVSMELLIAAALSDGHCGAVNPMLEMYRSGDPYLSFAQRVGSAPQDYDAELHGDIRNKYKLMMLSSQYGISPFTLGGRLNVPTFEANILLDEHRTLFSQYWAWSDDYIQHAMQTGVMRTAFGWTYHIGLISDTNVRSLRNWPIQSAGADILRIACILAVRHGIKLLAPIHDAVLIEAPDDRIEADAALMQEIMRRASRIVLNNTADGTHELRTDAKIIRYPNRYFDKRGAEVWNNVLKLLEQHQRQKMEKDRVEAIA